MRRYLFSKTDISGRFAFRSYYILQNLRTAKTISAIFFVFTIIIRFIFSSFHLSTPSLHHIGDYGTANWIALFTTPLFFILSDLAIKRFADTKKMMRLSQALVLVFALFLIVSGMRATFFSMYNPRNTMLMYMLGLVLASVFFTFEYSETLLVILATGVIFSCLLPFYQSTIEELILNNIASALLLTSFFCISRYVYAYRADNFFKIKAIEEKNIEIENASNAKNEILGIVAHDLRNPLAVIKTVTAMMETEGYDPAQDNKDNIEMIKNACDKATSIIHDLLENAQNEVHNNFDLEKTELGDFLSMIIDEWLKNKKGQVKIIYQNADKPLYANIHKEKMQRVMDNLIINAIKFSKPDGNIDVTLSQSNKNIFIKVRDYGIGIPADMQPYIFDRFSKARRNGVRGEASVGLGLSIVHQIIKKHAGNIEVSSTPDSGTTFTIQLPQLQSA